jgi:hypothetical protein
MRPSLPSCDPRRLRTAIAVFVRPLPHLSSQRSRRREAGHPLADALLILVPSLVLAGGTVEEQITYIRKISCLENVKQCTRVSLCALELNS